MALPFLLGALSFSWLGCGDDSNDGKGGSSSSDGDGATTHATATSTTSTSSTTASSSSTGGGGNHTLADATPIELDAGTITTSLVDPHIPDFYSFSAAAGERIYISAVSPLQGFGDPAFADLGLLLVGPNMDIVHPLTYQQSSYPHITSDPRLFAELPEDGTYYIGVADCNAFSTACPIPASGITHLEYGLNLLHTSHLTPGEVVAGPDQDGTIAHAVGLPYMIGATMQTGYYSTTFLGGWFENEAETHVFRFTPPTDAVVTEGARHRVQFFVQPIGSDDGDLSLANVEVWITDATGNIVLSRADQSHYPIGAQASGLELSAPVTLGEPYFLFVKNTHAPVSPITDTYFVRHYLDYYADLAELEGPTNIGLNDDATQAEALVHPDATSTVYAIDGDISAPGPTGDVDWFSFDIPSGVTQYLLQCDAARSGSGLGGLTVELFGEDATTSYGQLIETLDTDLITPVTPIPAGNTKLYLEVQADTQSSTVQGTFYRCFVSFG